MRLKAILISTVIAASTATSVKAASFVNVQVLGSTSLNGPYTDTVAVTAGQTVYYEVVQTVASAGTSNSQKNYTLGTQVPATDGVNSLYLNLGTGSTPIGLPTFGAGYSVGTGATNGTQASSTSVTAIYAAQANGVHVGVGVTSTVLTGNLTAGAASDTLTAAYDFDGQGQGAGVFTTNLGEKSINFTPTSEAKADPYVSYAPLTLTEAASSVPAPSIVPMVGGLLAMLGIVRFSRLGRLA